MKSHNIYFLHSAVEVLNRCNIQTGEIFAANALVLYDTIRYPLIKSFELTDYSSFFLLLLVWTLRFSYFFLCATVMRLVIHCIQLQTVQVVILAVVISPQVAICAVNRIQPTAMQQIHNETVHASVRNVNSK